MAGSAAFFGRCSLAVLPNYCGVFTLPLWRKSKLLSLIPNMRRESAESQLLIKFIWRHSSASPYLQNPTSHCLDTIHSKLRPQG